MWRRSCLIALFVSFAYAKPHFPSFLDGEETKKRVYESPNKDDLLRDENIVPMRSAYKDSLEDFNQNVKQKQDLLFKQTDTLAEEMKNLERQLNERLELLQDRLKEKEKEEEIIKKKIQKLPNMYSEDKRPKKKSPVKVNLLYPSKTIEPVATQLHTSEN